MQQDSRCRCGRGSQKHKFKLLQQQSGGINADFDYAILMKTYTQREAGKRGEGKDERERERISPSGHGELPLQQQKGFAFTQPTDISHLCDRQTQSSRSERDESTFLFSCQCLPGSRDDVTRRTSAQVSLCVCVRE